MTLTIYQTLEDLENPEQVESDGPFPCRKKNAWLGNGYYFWDSHIELAHFWGEGYGTKGYIICKAKITVDESLWDLHTRPEHRKEFEKIYDFILKENINDGKKVTVPQVIEYLKKKGIFKYSAIRMLGMHTIANNKPNSDVIKRVPFRADGWQVFDIFPPVQICLIKKNSLSLRDFLIVYPQDYVADLYA